MDFPRSIFEYVTTEENAYKTREIQVSDNVNWNMYTHLSQGFNLKNGWFINATNELKTKHPFKNVITQILEFRYSAEDRDVKDILIYIEDPEKHHLSFLVKKYWENVFTIENDIDSFLDDIIEEKIDYGGCLVRKGKGAIPEAVSLREIAFCDQTDILGGPIGFKFNLSPDKLRSKSELGWGDKKYGADITLENLVILAKNQKDASAQGGGLDNQTTGKNIEVYVVRGEMPESYLKDRGEEEVLINQIQVVAFYKDDKNPKGKTGVTLFKNKETEEVFKFHTPKKVFNRALGKGTVEELYDAQIWTNFAEIQKMNMLKAASKIVFQTSDDNFVNRNKVRDMENLEVITVKEGSLISQIPNGSPNIQLFNQALVEWENHARVVGGATEPLLGVQPPAGTPFRLQERVVFEGKKPHERRAGKFDKFLEEIIRDWILPHIAREITRGKKFLATLSSDEMVWLSERIATNRAAKQQIEDILSGRLPEDFATLKERFRQEFVQGGNERFIEILKDELRGVELKVKINIAGKQADLSLLTDKLVNVLRQYLAAPQLRQDPVANKLLNKILEASGISPIDFAEVATSLPPIPETATRPIKELSKREVIKT